MKRINSWIATFFGVGRLPLAPGTWASLLVTIVTYLVFISRPLFLAAAAVVVLLIGTPAAFFFEKEFGRKDPRPCVIDEVAGQMIALIGVPHSLGLFALSFLLFRFFDVLKPFPIKRSERIPYGIGIMVDDVLAGLYALAGLALLRRFF
jgi:phosphatidylglycerophosphatase A